jgi:hypothetical protein
MDEPIWIRLFRHFGAFLGQENARTERIVFNGLTFLHRMQFLSSHDIPNHRSFLSNSARKSMTHSLSSSSITSFSTRQRPLLGSTFPCCCLHSLPSLVDFPCNSCIFSSQADFAIHPCSAQLSCNMRGHPPSAVRVVFDMHDAARSLSTTVRQTDHVV